MNKKIKFGKFYGYTFVHVLKYQKEYCNWILTNLDYNTACNDRKEFYNFINNNRFLL